MSYPTASQVIAKAKAYVRTSAYGSPNDFTRWYGFGSQAVAWCGVFVYYVLSACGGKDLMSGCSNKAYIPTIWNWGKAKGYNRTSPAMGDLVIFDWNDNYAADHIGFFIQDLGGNYVQTVEGNTSNTSNGNGGCVQIRTRSKSDIMGYIRLPYGTSGTTTSVASYTATGVTTDALNARRGAGTGYAKVTTYKKGTTLSIVGKCTVSGTTWYKLSNGYYVCGSWVSIKSSSSSASTSINWIAQLQSECNRQGLSNQKVDGKAGPNTLKGCPVLKVGKKGNITKIFQQRLNALGYSCGTADGIFGANTKSALIKFQKAKGLVADGICGTNTWRKLLGI